MSSLVSRKEVRYFELFSRHTCRFTCLRSRSKFTSINNGFDSQNSIPMLRTLRLSHWRVEINPFVYSAARTQMWKCWTAGYWATDGKGQQGLRMWRQNVPGLRSTAIAAEGKVHAIISEWLGSRYCTRFWWSRSAYRPTSCKASRLPEIRSTAGLNDRFL